MDLKVLHELFNDNSDVKALSRNINETEHYTFVLIFPKNKELN